MQTEVTFNAALLDDTDRYSVFDCISLLWQDHYIPPLEANPMLLNYESFPVCAQYQ